MSSHRIRAPHYAVHNKCKQVAKNIHESADQKYDKKNQSDTAECWGLMDVPYTST